jgi:hypothetical protein
MRSIIPGHEHCENYRDPVPPTHEIALDPTGERKQTWGWHLFPGFNAITEADFSHQKRGSVRIEYWNVWEMGATRPDAHIAWTGGFFDCLHVSRLDCAARWKGTTSHPLISSGVLRAFLNALFICGITLFLRRIGRMGPGLSGVYLAFEGDYS